MHLEEIHKFRYVCFTPETMFLFIMLLSLGLGVKLENSGRSRVFPLSISLFGRLLRKLLLFGFGIFEALRGLMVSLVWQRWIYLLRVSQRSCITSLLKIMQLFPVTSILQLIGGIRI